MAAGTGLPPQLIAYWVHGEGAAKIGWGTPGDFDRAIKLIQEAIAKGGGKPLSDRIIKGLVATLHKLATGARPGHAAGEHRG